MHKILPVVMLCFLVISCAPKPDVPLDENAAIGVGNAFLKDIMNQSYQAAYDAYMSPGIKFNPNSTLEQFSADWAAITEKYGVLQKAVFDAYQLVPGKRVIQLYYTVTHEKVEAPVVYHFVLEQNKQGVFTIFLVDIGNEKTYPPNTAEPAAKLKKDRVIEVVPD